MSMVEHHPGMVMLGGIGAVAHVEPLNAPCEDHSGRKWAARQHVGGTSSSDPLQAYQQGELTLHGSSQSQSMADKVQHRRGRLFLSFVRPRVAIRRICHDAAASSGYVPACEEVDPSGAEPSLGDIRRNHFVAMSRQHVGDGAVATAGLPNRTAETHMLQQCLCDPGRCGIEVPPFPIITRDMDGTALGCRG